MGDSSLVVKCLVGQWLSGSQVWGDSGLQMLRKSLLSGLRPRGAGGWAGRPAGFSGVAAARARQGRKGP